MGNKAKHKKNKHGFLKFILAYTLVLFIAIAAAWWLLYDLMGDYEESRPATTMDEVVSMLGSGDVAGVLRAASVETNEFESDTKRLETYLADALSGTNVRYVKKSGEYTENTPVYLIYAEDTPVAKVSLVSSGQNRFGFTTWKLGSIYVGSDLGLKKSSDITINVPKGSEVSVNGVRLSESYIIADDIEIETCKNVGEYVAEPLKTSYKVSGLMMQPQITATYGGNALEITEENGTYTAGYPQDEALLESMRASITTLNHAYGEYIINKGSLYAVTSHMVGVAKDYMSDIPAVWAFLYGKEYVYEFQNETIDNFVKYSDDCFSCHVYYDLYVTWNTGNVTYATSLTYTYVNYDGNWVVADFSIE